MDILVIGSGGREHAIIKKLRENPAVATIYALPGNGGIAADARCVDIAANDVDGIASFAVNHAIDFAVVGPDDPLALGCVDRLQALGIPAFGPDARAARIESSKVFAKDLMRRYSIPTADYAAYSDSSAALSHLGNATYPLVIKADGLALGKGVVIAQNRQEAEDAIRSIMDEQCFGSAGNQIVIEEFLTGPEVSVLAFTDGITLRPMVSAMDHKRAGDGDTGLNTGGMGTIAPNPYYTPEIAKICMETIFMPTLSAMAAEGCPFKGCLFFGLMLTPHGPKIIEYNCRFGDPETQVVLPLLETDLLRIMEAVVQGTLAETPIRWRAGAAACVILASGGYPQVYEKGKAITLPAVLPKNVALYHAGSCRDEAGQLRTNGGRVLGVSAMAATLPQAVDIAYTSAKTIHFDGAFMRHDIGQRALTALED